MKPEKNPKKGFFSINREPKKITHIHTQQPQKRPKSGLYNAAPGDTFRYTPQIKKTVKRAKTTWGRFIDWIKHHVQLVIIIGATLGIILFGLFFIWIATLKLPTLDNFTERKVISSTKIMDRTGEIVLYDVHENVKRTVVPSENISLIIKQAVIAIEDKDFYNHYGIKFSSTLRGALSQFLPSRFVNQSGGSTITQQVIKNTLLNSEKRISRKIKEWILALKLEKTMDKEQILALYLNEAPYGGSIYGIEEAARIFFGKSSSDVTIAEAAYLAAIPNAPTYYSPYGKNKDKLDQRKNLVLKMMSEQNYITSEQFESAKSEEVKFKPKSDNEGKALHFVDYIRSYLEETYGKEMLLTEGLKVTTTLDWKIQEVAEKTIKENALKNQETYNASNSALVAIDPKTGQILSMVGSRDYSDTEIDGQYNVALAKRQPGSSFKPIVYARAFEKGYRPETVLFDVPTQFNPSCGAFSRESTGNCYAPDNYDGKFVGPISLRNALGQSRNIPAVQLLYLVGIGDALQKAKQLGITTLDRNFDRYGLTLVLGGGETTLLEMTSVYGVFANDGVRVPPIGILKIEDLNGKVLEEYKPSQGEQVISIDAARMVSSVLADNEARTPLFGANSQLNFGGRSVAAKSGTTNDNRDAWLIGYSPEIAVGVWSGNNDNKPMKKGSSISIPAWREVMNTALQLIPSSSFGSYPDTSDETSSIIRGKWWGGESFFTDSISGKLATEYTPKETKKEHVMVNPHNILYWIDKNNPTVSKSGIGISDSQYKNWEASFQNWISTNGLPFIETSPEKPTEYDDVHKPEFQPTVTIFNTQDVYNLNQEIVINASAIGLHPIQKYEFYINNIFIGSIQGNSLIEYRFAPIDFITTAGNAEITVVAVDDIFNRGEKKISIQLQ